MSAPTTAATSASPAQRGPGWPALTTLAGAALAWPLLDEARRAPLLLAEHGLSGSALVRLAVVAGLGLPLAVGLLPALVGRVHAGLGRGLSQVFAALLLTLLCLELARRGLAPALGGDVTVVASAVAAGAATAALLRWRLPGRLLAWAAPLVLVMPVVFVSDPAVSALRAGDQTALVAAVPAAAPVVVVLFDELPTASLLGDDGAIDRLLFPAFARLADRASWFRQATSVHEDGALAERCLRSGRRDPSVTTGADLVELLAATHRRVLFERDDGADDDGDAGDHGASESSAADGAARDATDATDAIDAAGTQPGARDASDATDAAGTQPGARDATGPPRSLAADLLSLAARRVLPEPFRSRVPAARGDPGARPLIRAGEEIDDRVLRFGAFASSLKPTAAPTLTWLSTSLPGAPWTLMPSGLPAKADDPATGLDDGVWSSAPALPERAHQRHLLQLGACDRLLGQLLDQLEQRDLFERSLVIVSARRGAAFSPGLAHRRIELGNAAQTAPVPLLIKAPLQTTGRVDDRNAELIDVLPTVADLLGLPLPTRVDGVSLVGPPPAVRAGKTVGRRDRAPLQLVAATFDVPAAVARRRQRYGPAPSWPDILAQGTGRDVRGRGVGDLGVAAVLPADGVLAGVRSASGRGPLHLAGFVRVWGQAALPATLAVTLDERVVATTPSEPRGADRLAFSLLLPEDVLGDGRRSLGLYAVQDGPTLAVIPQVSFALERGDDGEPVLVSTDGRPWPLDNPSVTALVEQAERGDGRLTLSGWAGDPAGRRPADAVLVFRGERLVAAAPTGVPRPEVAARHRVPALTPSGYELSLSLDALGAHPDGDVRVVALLDDRAALCEPSRQARWLGRVSWRLEGGQLVGSDGRRLALTSAAAVGALAEATREGDRVVLKGWAADLSGAGPVERFVVLVDGQDGDDALPGAPRPDLARGLGLEVSTPLSFVVGLADAWFDRPIDGRVRVFALVGERATELPVAAEAAWVAAPTR